MSTYNRSNPTKILIHGFSDKGLTSWVKTFKKKYLERYDANVISVDWEPLARYKYSPEIKISIPLLHN